MGFLDSLKHGLERSREAISEVFYMGGEVDEAVRQDYLAQSRKYIQLTNILTFKFKKFMSASDSRYYPHAQSSILFFYILTYFLQKVNNVIVFFPNLHKISIVL